MAEFILKTEIHKKTLKPAPAELSLSGYPSFVIDKTETLHMDITQDDILEYVEMKFAGHCKENESIEFIHVTSIEFVD